MTAALNAHQDRRTNARPLPAGPLDLRHIGLDGPGVERDDSAVPDGRRLPHGVNGFTVGRDGRATSPTLADVVRVLYPHWDHYPLSVRAEAARRCVRSGHGADWFAIADRAALDAAEVSR